MGRAKVRLAESHLNAMLTLPEDNRVVAAQAGMDPFGIVLIVEGPDLPVVPPDAEAPYAQTMVQVREGRLCIDFVWPDAQPVPPPWPDEADDEEMAAYDDWKREVEHGDTVLGFRDWTAKAVSDGS